MIKIVADDKIPYLQGALEPFAEVFYVPGKDIANAALKDADALIIRTRTLCNKELLEGTKVRFIATATIGFDHIDTDYCAQNQIEWTSAPGCNSGSVMQYIASALVTLSRKYDFRFSEKTIGIIGFGNVGSKVARLASIMGFKVLVNDPPLQRAGILPQSVTLEEIKKKADILSFHVPLIKEGIDKTLHLVDAEFLKSIKPTAILINSSRGNIIDNQELKKVLKNKKIGGAVLDVWENEPAIDVELLNLVDLATPHIAGYSADGKANGTAMSIQAVSDYFGFGLKNWFPANIPLLESTILEVDNEDHSKQVALSKLIIETYDIKKDHKRLLQSVETFEKQRGDYPLRWEFANYTVQVKNHDLSIVEAIKNCGFNTL